MPQTSGVDGVWVSLWDSGNLASGASSAQSFAADGTFPYFCRHQYLSGMKGVVMVGTSGVNETPGTDKNSVCTSKLRFGQCEDVRCSSEVSTNDTGRARYVRVQGRPRQPRTETGPDVYFFRHAAGALASDQAELGRRRLPTGWISPSGELHAVLRIRLTPVTRRVEF